MAKFKIGIECESIEGKNSNLPAGRQVWGVGKMIVRLLEEISRRPELEKDHKFVLYFKDSIPDLPFLNSPIFQKKKVPVPFFKNRLFPIYYFALLPLKLWFERLDYMFWPNYMLPIIAPGKSIVTLTEDVYYETYGKLPFRYRLAYFIFCWWTAKFATKIMAISETSKKNIAKLYDIRPARIFVNYPGVDPVRHRKTDMQHSPYLLYVGQAFPRRHLKESLLALEKISGEFPDMKFIAIGPDKYPEATIDPIVKNINAKLNQEAVVHKDYVSKDELASLYSKAKALIYVSDREAFGLPPLEALAFGVPPIIMDNELGHELFGEYAFYSKSGELDDITNAIIQALTDQKKIEKIRTEGPEFVKKYNWKNFAERFLNNVKG